MENISDLYKFEYVIKASNIKRLAFIILCMLEIRVASITQKVLYHNASKKLTARYFWRKWFQSSKRIAFMKRGQ